MWPALIPVLSSLIDRLFPDKKESDKAKAEMMTILAESQAKELDARASVIKSEAQGESWLQRNWRPLLMCWYAILIGSYWFGAAPQYLIDNPEIVKELFYWQGVGITGYIASRGYEKVTRTKSDKDWFESIRRVYGPMSQQQVDELNKK